MSYISETYGKNINVRIAIQINGANKKNNFDEEFWSAGKNRNSKLQSKSSNMNLNSINTDSPKLVIKFQIMEMKL
jgi:hypothetical protein